MSRILLIGTDGGKRKFYFEKAAALAGVPVDFLDWRDVPGYTGCGATERLWAFDGKSSIRVPGYTGCGATERLRAFDGKSSIRVPGYTGCGTTERDPGQKEGLCLGTGRWDSLCGQGESLEQYAVKVDAPEWESCCLEELDALTGQYSRQLSALSRLPAGAFLNYPDDIAEVLDKRKCKERLIREKIPVTEMADETFSTAETLLAFLRERRIGQVFLKPVRGSGAAGVTALRYAGGAGKLVLYTCAALEGGRIYNTKRMYRLEGREAEVFLDSLLQLECVVERWHAKAVFQGYCYDLRVIVQGGQVDVILPRLSKGPITNLHLNNHSMAFADLGLDRRTTERICEVSIRAAGCYPRLHSIGMDVLLEKGTLAPRIIEMNAQGDLLHRDVYGENRIYGRQVVMMREMLEAHAESIGRSAASRTGQKRKGWGES